MKGKIPIISTGGGALFSGFGKKKNFELNKIIHDTLGINVNLILLVPNPSQESSNFESYNGDIHALQEFYTETSVGNVGQAVKARLNRQDRGWQIPDNFYPRRKGKSLDQIKVDPDCIQEAIENFCKKITNVSVSNYEFVNELVKLVDDVITYPTYEPDVDFETYLNLNLDYNLILSKITIPRDIASVGKFSQHRILAKIVGEDDIRHLTVEYRDERSITLSIEKIKKINETLLNKMEFDGLSVILKTSVMHKNKKDKLATCQFVIPLPKPNNDYFQLISDYFAPFLSIFYTRSTQQSLSAIEDILPKYAHVTINSGRHKPALMKDATKAILEDLGRAQCFRGKTSVTLPTVEGENLTYDISDAQIQEVRIQLIKNFAF